MGTLTDFHLEPPDEDEDEDDEVVDDSSYGDDYELDDFDEPASEYQIQQAENEYERWIFRNG
jgi:hypothetical protein